MVMHTCTSRSLCLILSTSKQSATTGVRVCPSRTPQSSEDTTALPWLLCRLRLLLLRVIVGPKKTASAECRHDETKLLEFKQ